MVSASTSFSHFCSTHFTSSLSLRAGGKIKSGPQVGEMATSPLPYRGSPPLRSGGQNQKWPTSGQNGYLTPAVSGIPTASERGAKSEVAHKWAKWLPHPCRLGDPHRFRVGGKIRSGPQVGEMATSPLLSRGSPPLQRWGKIRSGPQVGKMATSPLPSRASPPLQSGGQNQKWPTNGQSGFFLLSFLLSKKKFFFLLGLLLSKIFFYLLSSLLSLQKKFFTRFRNSVEAPLTE